MAGESLFETLGLPVQDDARRARARMRERGLSLLEQGQVPWPSKLSEPPSGQEGLSQCTGLPTHADIFGHTPCLEEWAKEQYPDLEADEEEDDDGWDPPWWAIATSVLAWAVWKLLDRPVEFDSGDLEWTLDGFEIDGIPWTVEEMYEPKAPFAARVGDPMLHGGLALPGGWQSDVIINGKPALTVGHLIASCPMTTSLGVQHVPQSLAWTTTNTSVVVNGELLLRAGDYAIESPGGPNPISMGAPTVLAGRKADPVMVQTVTHKPLSDFIPGLESVGWTGGSISLKASVRWHMHDALKGLGAIGLLHLGAGSPMLAPLTGLGARALLNSMKKPEILFELDGDTGSVWGKTREESDSPLWGSKVEETLHEFKFPDWYFETSAEVDPENPAPPTKKEEKEGWKPVPWDKDPKVEEDHVKVGPYSRRSRTWDADEGPPESWDEEE